MNGSCTVKEVEKLLSSIKAASNRMNSLLTALGMPHGQRSETLSEMLTRVVDAATNIHQGLTVNIELPEIIGNLDVGSYRLLETCCTNLLRNSAEFGGDDVRVLMRIQLENSSISIRVSDNGPGVAPSILSKLFTRGATTNSGGLGLYLTKQILETYGGTITLEESTSEGATFLIKLPITKP
jgi:signal transduction histidine kinase